MQRSEEETITMRKRSLSNTKTSPVDAMDFRAVADSTYDWESWHEPAGALRWVNPAVERFTGFSVAECLTMTAYPLPLVAPESRAQVADVLRKAADRGSGNDVEFVCVHRDGSRRAAAMSWQPMYDRVGGYLGYRTSVRDVTDRRKLREQLRLHAEHLEQLVQERTARIQQLEAQRRAMEKMAALGQLAAGVAHEINNPLAGIRNVFELVKKGTSPQHENYELLELVDREIERISEIVHQMYQLYRPSPRLPSAFPIERAIADVVRLLARAAEKAGIVINFVPANHPLIALLPEGEVKQVLFNLVLNAVQASSPGQFVNIDVLNIGDQIRVRVQDAGTGIAAELLPRIFDPFVSTKEEDSRIGMGLGLSVSKSLVEALGGRLEVESEVGRGSTFTAYFPLQLTLTPGKNQ